MDGILLIDKPVDFTSHDVVARVRRILKTKRVGHTGTLDPFATGLLVLLIGKATRLSQFLVGCQKTYEAVARIGFATDTQDWTGKPITPVLASDELPISSLRKILPEFVGRQLQLPPMFSAKKVSGVALHHLARQGQEVERQPVAVEVYELTLTAPDWVQTQPDGTREFAFRVRCSAGTYVRTLAHDLGQRLGYGAHLTALRRTAVDSFTLAQAQTLASLEALTEAERAATLLPLSEALPALPRVLLGAAEAQRLIQGQTVAIGAQDLADGAVLQALTADAVLVGIGRFRQADQVIIPWVILADTMDISRSR